MTVPTGYVAIQSVGPRPPKLHLVRTDQTGTLCGRYSLDRILPDDAEVPGAMPCKVCLASDRVDGGSSRHACRCQCIECRNGHHPDCPFECRRPA